MEVNITEKSNWEKYVEVTAPLEEFEKDFEEAYQDYKKKIQLEGFRRGKVPVNLIKQIFGKEIEANVAEQKIPDILTEIRNEHKFQLISPAKIEEFSFDHKNGLKFKALLEVVPAIELKKYKGLNLEKEIYVVGDKDIENAMESLKEQHAILEVVEQEAKIGHQLIVDFQKLDETGVPMIGEKYENRLVYLTENEKEDDNQLTNQLLGVKAGDVRKVNLSFTDDQNRQQLEKYSISIKEVKEKKYPEINDDFAKDVGEFENLEQLKEKLTEDINRRSEQEYNRIFADKMMDELIKENQFDLPEPMIKNYLDLLVERLTKNSKEKIDEQEIREQYRGEAVRRLKWSVIRDTIIDLEKIKLDENEVDDYIDEVVKTNEKNSLQIKNYYRKQENREQLEEDLIEKKVNKLLEDSAKVTEKKVTLEDLTKKSRIIT